MPRVLIVTCSSYSDNQFGCPADWKCFRGAAEKRGAFAQYDDEVKVVGFLKCRCPGRSLIGNIKATREKVEFDAIHLANCMMKAEPRCKNHDLDKLPEILSKSFDVPVVVGTHDFG